MSVPDTGYTNENGKKSQTGGLSRNLHETIIHAGTNDLKQDDEKSPAKISQRPLSILIGFLKVLGRIP